MTIDLEHFSETEGQRRSIREAAREAYELVDAMEARTGVDGDLRSRALTALEKITTWL